MSPRNPDRAPVPFPRFLRAVTRFPRDQLLEALAVEGVRQTQRHKVDPRTLVDGRSPVTPWAITEIAREAIVHGLQNGGPAPSGADVHRLCALFAELDDPLADGGPGSLDRFLVRIAFEQFPWQQSTFEEIARSHALLVDTAASVLDSPADDEARWQAALGCRLADFVGIGFFLFVWAAEHGGWIDTSWLSGEQFRPLLERFPRDEIEAVIDEKLAGTPGELARLDGGALPGSVNEHRFNPLVTKPLVRTRDGRLLAVQPLLLLQRLGVGGLYYDRVRKPGFTDRLGATFERYVGDHLDLVRNADVHHSIHISAGDEVIDHVVVLPEVTLLVEDKATRLTEQARAGLDRLDHDRERTIGKACRQIQRATDLIAADHPAFAFVPRDRPIRGLIVTLEPYWLAATGFGPPLPTTHPTVVAHIREVERLASAGIVGAVGPALLTLDGANSNQAVLRAIEGLPVADNPILDRGWEAALSFA